MSDVHTARPLASATSLNPSAGQHVVTADPQELAASERAGNRSWLAWTYYPRRYGDRGRQFTRSDSAWITALSSHPPAAVEQELRWLAELLAARGMPRLLLEEHLRVLHQELISAVPERALHYAVLRQVAERLGAEREAIMPERLLAALETGFREQLGGTGDDDMRAGVLIGAAVADEQAGVPRAVESLLEWLAEPARFSARWVAAVQNTLMEARASVRKLHETDTPVS